MFASRVYVAITSMMSSLRCGDATTWNAIASYFKSGARATRAGRGRGMGRVTGLGSRALRTDHPPGFDSPVPMSSPRSARKDSIG